MTINLGNSNNNYAIFLPAIQQSFAEYVVSNDADTPKKIKPKDLNFLDGSNKFWAYPWCLASAGVFVNARKSNSITNRDPNHSWVLGDSGGYQVGTGKLREIYSWGAFNKDVSRIKQLWKEKTFINDMLRWVECNSDYAVTLDMPLWIHDPEHKKKYKKTPFYHLTKEELLEITVNNLEYIQNNKGMYGNCKFLNVLQGLNDNDEDEWYQEVKKFKFEGWALGGSNGWKGGLSRVLRRLLILRDDGNLNPGQDYLHVLGVSQINWCIALTAIQRGIQKSANNFFKITYDASTPYQNSYTYQRYFVPQEFNENLSSWKRSIIEFPNHYEAVKAAWNNDFCKGSPLSNILTVGDVSKPLDPFEKNFITKFGSHALANHNTYVMIEGFHGANLKANDQGNAPSEFNDLVSKIDQLFELENWYDFLESNRDFFEFISNHQKW